MSLTHTSTPISQAEVRIFRLLKKSALTFLLLLSKAGDPLTEKLARLPHVALAHQLAL